MGMVREAMPGRSGLVAQLTRRVVERALAGGADASLGCAKGEEPPGENRRNGSSARRVRLIANSKSFHRD
jgi:transposase-like protein